MHRLSLKMSLTMSNSEVSLFNPNKPGLADKRVLDEIIKALSDLRFGTIEITVHESRVTQIERREKVRLT